MNERMINDRALNEVLEYRKAIDEAQIEIARAEGKLEAAMSQLWTEHQCRNYPRGEERLKKLRKELATLKTLGAGKMKTFKTRWKRQLEL